MLWLGKRLVEILRGIIPQFHKILQCCLISVGFGEAFLQLNLEIVNTDEFLRFDRVFY